MKRRTQDRFLHPNQISDKFAESDKLTNLEKWLIAGAMSCLAALIIIAAFWQYAA